LGFEHPEGAGKGNVGFAVTRVRQLGHHGGKITQAINAGADVPDGWVVVRSAHAALLAGARSSFADVGAEDAGSKAPIGILVGGAESEPLTVRFTVGRESVTVRSAIALSRAEKRPLDRAKLEEQLGRLGETPFVLGALDCSDLATDVFLPVSALNDLRQEAVRELLRRKSQSADERLAAREAAIDGALNTPSFLIPSPGRARGRDLDSDPGSPTSGAQAHAADPSGHSGPQDEEEKDIGPWDEKDTGDVRGRRPPYRLTAEVWRLEDAVAAADAGATEISLDLFLRHPTPPVSRVRSLVESLRERGIVLRLRTPTIVRPEERKVLDKWLALGTPLVSGHLGLVAELARAGRDVVADYAVNCFNQHSAREIFRLGASRIVLSIELTGDEMVQTGAPWQGGGFEIFAYGRPEGMTIEHCTLAAAFEREPATCRDLCVQKHPHVELTDPAGYVFPVATDAACRNRLLHSRPVDASEYLPFLWRRGFRNFRLVFNVPGDPVAEVTAAYHEQLRALADGRTPDPGTVRVITGGSYTRGHFARAV
jgi:putative protease